MTHQDDFAAFLDEQQGVPVIFCFDDYDHHCVATPVSGGFLKIRVKPQDTFMVRYRAFLYAHMWQGERNSVRAN